MIRIQPGDKLTFSDERQSYTVQAVSSNRRWVVATRPFKARDTVLYTVVDFQEELRGVDNCHGLGYETREDCERAAGMFESGEAEFSRRSQPILFQLAKWTRGEARRG
jgi:hypothetical protein